MTVQNAASQISNYILLIFVCGIPLYAALRNVKVYESFVAGAKEGLPMIVRLLPFLLGMLVAVGMLRAAGAFELLAQTIGPVLSYIGFPAEVLPVALMRPFSGGAANGVMADIAATHGGDSYLASVAATIVGSTETTFYVLAVYFGAVGIRRTRHAVPAGLIADVVGILAAVLVCNIVFL